MIRVPGNRELALVLSREGTYYYKITKDYCVCDEFIHGTRPCEHQIRVFWASSGNIRRKAADQKRLSYNEEEHQIKERKPDSCLESLKQINVETSSALRMHDSMIIKQVAESALDIRIKENSLEKIAQSLPTKVIRLPMKEDVGCVIPVEDDVSYDPLKGEKDIKYRRDLYG